MAYTISQLLAYIVANLPEAIALLIPVDTLSAFLGVYNVQLYGAKGDGVVTNDKDAINAALLAAFNAGGGEVYLPFTPDGYYVAGALNEDTNSLIAIPQNPWTGATIKDIPITIRGSVKPSWGDYKGGYNGVKIFTDAAGSGSYPAVIGGKTWSGAVAPNYENYNYVDVTVENLRVSTFDNPTIGGINLANCNRSAVASVLVDVNTPETTPGSTAPSEPTHNVVGIMLSQVENNGRAIVENCTVTGYLTGFYGSDHFRAIGFVMAARCKVGFWFDDLAGSGHGMLYSYRNKQDLKFTNTAGGPANRFAFVLHIEPDITSGTWTERTPGTDNDFTDVNNSAEGELLYTATFVSEYAPTFTGMSKVNFRPFFNSTQTAKFSRASAQVIPSGTPTNILWNQKNTGGMPIIHSDSSDPDEFTIALAGWYEFTFGGWLATSGGATDNGTGARQVALVIDGNVAGLAQLIPTNGNSSVIRCSLFKGMIAKGSVVTVYISHAAGVDLDLLHIGSAGAEVSPVLEIVKQ